MASAEDHVHPSAEDARTRSSRLRKSWSDVTRIRSSFTSATSVLIRLDLPRREPLRRRVVLVQFTAAVTHEGGWYVARALEVEVTSQGRTVDEALANLREALELYFEDETMPEVVEPPIIATVQLSA